MKIRLLPRSYCPDGSPITLRIRAAVLEAPDASGVIRAIREHIARVVIPHIPFTRKDDQARAWVLEMSNTQFARELVTYLNAHNGQAEPDQPIPVSDTEALSTFVRLGLLTIVNG